MRSMHLTLLFLFYVQACALQAGVDSAAPAEDFSNDTAAQWQRTIPELRKMEQAMAEQIRNMAKTDCMSPEQCKSIAVGVNPCGGAGGFQIYSTQNTDEEKLRAVVKKYNRLNKFLNDKLGRMGACVFIEAPQTACVKQQCVSKY